MSKSKLALATMVMLIVLSIFCWSEENSYEELVLGGIYIKEPNFTQEDYEKEVNKSKDEYNIERFFRPSSMPILNNTVDMSLYKQYGNKYYDINISNKFLGTPEDSIINYFSVLREAANPTKNTKTGCGTLGDAKGPYPVAYNFLSDKYKKKVSYENYVDSFENKLHINLIKLKEVTSQIKNNKKYFVELEVIEGSDESKGVFAYYYGYIYLEKYKDSYMITNMEYNVENYLCAPYHGWSYDAKYLVEIEYGEWCSLVDGDIVIEQDGFEKRAYFKDKNHNEYYVLFYQLTNGVDIKIADYKKDTQGNWKLVYINPNKCLNNK